jgi:hypothetical protein
MTALNYLPSKSIPNGTKIVALYGDGSGAKLFVSKADGDLYDADNNRVDNYIDTYLLDAGFLYWIELPRTFKFWFEQLKGE